MSVPETRSSSPPAQAVDRTVHCRRPALRPGAQPPEVPGARRLSRTARRDVV